MSGANGHGHYSKTWRKGTFYTAPDEPCPSCMEEGRLNMLGMPFAKDAQPLWKQTRRAGKPRLSSDGCETCGGSGRVPVSKQPLKGCKSNDPMEKPLRG
jgi:hypothetical protein